MSLSAKVPETTSETLYRFGDVVYHVRSNVDFLRHLHANLAPFVCHDASPDISLAVWRIDVEAEPLQGLVLSELKETGNSDQIDLRLDVDLLLVRDFRRRSLTLFFGAGREGADALRPAGSDGHRVASFLRELFGCFLPSFSAVMVHAAAVNRNGRVALFLAPSGGGKSTVAGNAGRDLVLSDDQVILRRHGESTRVHPTPLGVVSGDGTSAPLGGLFLLEKANRFHLRKLDPREAAEYLWHGLPGFVSSLPRQSKTEAFAVLWAASQQAPAYQMSFPEGAVDWEAVDAAMGA